MANVNVGKDDKQVNAHLKLALSAGVKNKSLKQSKATGASGSFQNWWAKGSQNTHKGNERTLNKSRQSKESKETKSNEGSWRKGHQPKTKKPVKRTTAKQKMSKSSNKKAAANPKSKQNAKKKEVNFQLVSPATEAVFVHQKPF